MAVDQALLESVQMRSPPVLRLYLWDPPTLSFGRNQRAQGVYDPARALAAGIGVVRRPTGGLAVLHDQELTYCVLAPLDALGGPRRAYEIINDALVSALRSLGADASRARGGRARGPHHDTMEPCFREPSAGEVIAAGRKLIGSAQRSEGGALLQHGSILLDGTQATVQRLQYESSSPLAEDGAVTLRELLGQTSAPADVAAAIVRAFEETFGICLAPACLTRDELTRAAQLETRYAADEWTWRL
jgi:lipoate-protein ligase A